jgi:hypothetical protein
MRLRFLTSIASRTWAYQTGRVIEVDRLTAEQTEWLRRGVVEVIPDEGGETALAPLAAETALLPKAKRRRRPVDPFEHLR